MGTFRNLAKKTLPDIVLYFAILTVTNLLSRQTVRSTIGSKVGKILIGNREQPYQPVPAAESAADAIMKTLKADGVFRNSICIDGLPGSGKSSLGKALAERCNLEWRTLYWKEISEAYPFEEGKIYENMRLIRTQNVEHFDVVIYIDCTIEEAKIRILSRNRNAALADVVNFPRLKKIGDIAFDMLNGEEINMAKSSIRMKLRPKNGFRDLENLKDRLREKDLEVEGFSKEELLFIYCYGRPLSGVSPYVKLGAYNREIFSSLYNATALALAKKLSI